MRQDAAFSGPPTRPSSSATRRWRATMLGWTPTVAFEEIVARMVAADLDPAG